MPRHSTAESTANRTVSNAIETHVEAQAFVPDAIHAPAPNAV
jgi:hypothetical protein